MSEVLRFVGSLVLVIVLRQEVMRIQTRQEGER